MNHKASMAGGGEGGCEAESSSLKPTPHSALEPCVGLLPAESMCPAQHCSASPNLRAAQAG